MLAPCMVTLVEPVEAALPRRITLNATKSADTETVLLPTCTPALIDQRNDPLTPDPQRHIADVSDPHTVLSQVERETFPTPVYDTSPTPDPCRVKMADPVAA